MSRRSAQLLLCALALAMVACSDDDGIEQPSDEGRGVAGTANPAGGGATAIGAGDPTGAGADAAVGGTSIAEGIRGSAGGPLACETRSIDAAGNQVIAASPQNNYTFESTLRLPVKSVAPSSNLHFDWSGVTEDLWGHPVDPAADIAMVTLAVFGLPLDQFLARLREDNVSAGSFKSLYNVYPEDSGSPMTNAELADFGLMRSPIAEDPAEAEAMLRSNFDPNVYDPAETTYIVWTQGNETLGDTRSIQRLQAITPDPTSANTVVSITNDSCEVEYSVDLQSLEPVYLPAGGPQLTLDWSTLTRDARGRTIDPAVIDEVIIAKYTQSRAELEGELFADLELIATAWWSKRLESLDSNCDLSQLEATAGSNEFFPGIDDSGTWLLALRLVGSMSPEPVFLTVLSTCAP